MIARVKRILWFRPVTCWAAAVGVICFAYLLTQGVENKAVVRAVAGGWLLLVLGVVVAVRTYYREANKRARDPDRGALPRHVRQISESYILAVVYVVLELWMRAGLQLTWRIPLAVLIGVRGLQGLVSLIAFERRRVFFVAPFITDLRGSPHEERRG